MLLDDDDDDDDDPETTPRTLAEALRGTVVAAYRTAYLARRGAGEALPPSPGDVLAVIRRWCETGLGLDDVERLCLEFSLPTQNRSD